MSRVWEEEKREKGEEKKSGPQRFIISETRAKI